MKFEQACRFATSDSGYKIFAQSEGFSDQNAGNMTAVFNDVMNSIFGKVGQSMITLSICNSDVFFARLTLRSDVKSRKSMFTNAAVTSVECYSRMMMEDPTWMIHFPYKQLLTQRSGNERMDPIEIGDYIPQKETLAEICREYQLDRSALTEFIIQLYKAVTEGSSLCLVTDLDSAKTPDLVIRYAALAASLLPNSLRRKLTFSSMCDDRCLLCVQPRDGGELLGRGRGGFQFHADSKGREIYHNEVREIGAQNGMFDMLVNFANHLSSLLLSDREKLEKFLCEIDETANNISGTRKGCFSFALLIISYYLVTQKKYSLIEAVYLINVLLQYVQDNPSDDRVVDHLLGQLTDLLSDAGVCANIAITAPLTIRSIDQENGLLYDAVSKMLKFAADETRTDLAYTLLRKEYSERQKLLVNTLLIENPAPWSDDLLETIFAWSCRYNVTDLAPVIWGRKNVQISKQSNAGSETAGLLHRLIKDNIQQEQGLLALPEGELLFNESEMLYMSNGLTELCDGVNDEQPEEVLSDDEVRIVSKNFNDFNEPLQENWISYLIIFKYCAGKSLDQQILSLKSLKDIAPDVFNKICEALEAGRGAGTALLEAYWTDTLLGNCSSVNDLASVCNQYNVSRDSRGIMETKVRQLWLDKTIFDAENALKDKMDFLLRQYDILDAATLSSETCLYLKEELTLKFWEHVSLKELTDYAIRAGTTQNLIGYLKLLENKPDPEISRKLTAYYYTADAIRNPESLNNHAFFIEIVENECWNSNRDETEIDAILRERYQGELQYSYSDIEVLQKALLRIAKKHLVESKILFIDYYMVGTYHKDKAKPNDEGYDFEQFRMELDEMINKHYLDSRTEISLKDSILLNEDRDAKEFRKSIRKLITKNDPASLRRFAEQLKNPSKGIFSFLG